MFKSKAQRAFLEKNRPDIAAKWEKETTKPLPDRLGKTRKEKSEDKLLRGMAGKKV